MALRKIALGTVLASTLALAGCGATSQYTAGYVSADGDDVKAVSQGEFNEDASAQIAIVQNPDINGGRIPIRALEQIQKYAISCQQQMSPQIAGPGQSGVNGGVGYGLAGAGTGPAAAVAFSGASMGAYALYGGIAYILPGAVNGLVTGSYAASSAKGTCTRDFWDDKVKMDPSLFGTHVEVVYAGKAWGGSAPPNLEHSARASAPRN